MKIQTEQLQHLVDKQTSKVSGRKDTAGFDDLLAREMQEKGSQAATKATEPQATQATAPPSSGILGLHSLFATQQVNPSVSHQELMNTMDGVLNQLDQYAAKLGSPDVSLRSVYEELQGVGQQMDQLRQTMQAQGTSSPELDALYSEMEILATTETFKLNRGDYSAG
ncbi:hypothetical protein [Desulfoplanes formicivorans]|uniref:Uncharacterized protein n=1 Tax=Desulfoplanes formicivorans TaxID=1592317 RepID=A0A194AJ99_9BACT|nr:hypothetical protein [Desulfoplanes formicivorans]GAU09398.1 hypothetical protein DPF_2124 [Desulfoplanes formicivorans]